MSACHSSTSIAQKMGPEIDERSANKKRLSEERLEYSQVVDSALYKLTLHYIKLHPKTDHLDLCCIFEFLEIVLTSLDTMLPSPAISPQT